MVKRRLTGHRHRINRGERYAIASLAAVALAAGSLAIALDNGGHSRPKSDKPSYPGCLQVGSSSHLPPLISPGIEKDEQGWANTLGVSLETLRSDAFQTAFDCNPGLLRIKDYTFPRLNVPQLPPNEECIEIGEVFTTHVDPSKLPANYIYNLIAGVCIASPLANE